MGVELKLVLVEDVPTDAELALRELSRAGLVCKSRRVQTAAAFSHALEEFAPDLILADFSMPGFDGMSALAMARELSSDTPFIFVSGTIGEERAIEALKRGATDYVLKTNLARLGPVVLRAIQEKAEREARRQAQREVREVKERLDSILTEMRDGVWSVTLPGQDVLYLNQSVAEIYARPLEELRAHPLLRFDAIHSEDKACVVEAWRQLLEGSEEFEREYRIMRPDGQVRWIHDRARRILGLDGTPLRVDGTVRDITERKEAEEEIARQRAFLRQVIDLDRNLIFAKDRRGRFTLVNQAVAEAYGTTVEDLTDASDADLKSISQQGEPLSSAELSVLDTLQEKFVPEEQIVDPAGNVRWFQTTTRPIVGPDGTADMVLGVSVDITVRKRHEERIARLSRVYAVLSGINSTIVRVRDREDLFREACRIAVEQGGFAMAWIGTPVPATGKVMPAAWMGSDQGYLDEVGQLLAQTTDDPGSAGRALRERRIIVANDIEHDDVAFREAALARGFRSLAVLPLSVGEELAGVFVLYAAEPGFFDADELKLLKELGGDISFALDHIRKEEQLNYLAFYDALTGLANRNLLQDRLRQAAVHADRSCCLVAVLLLNLDRFRALNDSLGHEAGDALLQQVGQRLAACLREDDTVARLSGDEFAIVMRDIGGLEEIASVARKVLTAVMQPLVLGRLEVRASASIGISVYPKDGGGVESMLKNAGAAMDSAKSLGGNGFRFYAPEMNERIAARFSMEADLRRALEREELLLHFQPRVSLVSGEITGAEALVRWRHPQAGMMPPAQFIPLAEETGLIQPLGEWVIASVCGQLRTWLDARLTVPSVAVNLSARQLHQENLSRTIRQALRSNRLEPRLLELEITESVLMDDVETTAATLRELKALGLRLSLDDFGTGYSSLSYLKRLPIDHLKIDRTFVRDVTTDPEDAVICRAVIGLAHNLRLKVIAEGVETEGQMNYLRRYDCDEMQGYYFSRPLPAEEFAQLLARSKVLALPAVEDRRTILLVDDEPGILSALKRVLRRDGYRILTAGSASEGFAILAAHRVQVVLSDQRMPEMSGTEFLSRVRDLHPDTIRIVLSGYTELNTVTEAVNRGAIYRFLTKPWDDELLREHVREAFRHHEAAHGRPNGRTQRTPDAR